MLKYFFSVYFYFYVLSIIQFFLKESFSKKLQIVYNTLRNNISYRLPNTAKDDIFISFRELKRLIFSSFSNSNFTNMNYTNAIYDSNSKAFDLRSTYLNKFYDKTNYVNFSKDIVVSLLPLYSKLLLFLVLSTTSISTFLLNIFLKDKSKGGLKLRQFAECFALLYLCKKYKINKVFYFCIFEPDSNITSHILNLNKIETVLITSEVPLHFGNTKMVGTEVNFCFGYQLEEYEKYKSTILVDRIKLLTPENIFETAPYYIKTKDFNPPKNVIGFISSGMWLRKILGDNDSGFNELENESLIISYLQEYLSLNPFVKLIIYLHPIEKNPVNFKLTNNHYEKLFTGYEINFAPIDVKSSLSFSSADVCVSLYSTLLYERIFMGFKTLIVPLGFKEFPIENSSLDKSSAKTKVDLFCKLDLFLKLTNTEYISYINFNDKYYINFKKHFEI